MKQKTSFYPNANHRQRKTIDTIQAIIGNLNVETQTNIREESEFKKHKKRKKRNKNRGPRLTSPLSFLF